ncbi:T-cell surface glycoprotein CD3 epsilon chain [Spea bombifrons]|uniref:T-cell surface glycoprotein CD3 epsilon chain n=1 Tax=Spea bombifrons TaxID=233779 RepID=UPI00234A630D|nr:T-cell surface glycoprotein CD3 epsilon chain [Spea bombifrons]
MKIQSVPSVVVIWLCMGFISGQDEGSEERFHVSISGTTVQISCPNYNNDNNPETTLTNTDTGDKTESKDFVHELQSYTESKNGLYMCSIGNNKRYLYLKAYVCDNCIDLSVALVAGVLLADCLVTLGVAFVIYFGCKKKAGLPRDGGMANGGRNRGNKERPPPVPNPDYEPIRKGKQDVYDGLDQRFR